MFGFKSKNSGNIADYSRNVYRIFRCKGQFLEDGSGRSKYYKLIFRKAANFGSDQTINKYETPVTAVFEIAICFRE